MNEKKREEKLQYLRSMKDDPTAKYRDYLINAYLYILEDSKVDNKGWSKASSKSMLRFVYNGEPDHMGIEMIDQFKKELSDLGYIKIIKVDKIWKTYIVKEIDF